MYSTCHISLAVDACPQKQNSSKISKEVMRRTYPKLDILGIEVRPEKGGAIEFFNCTQARSVFTQGNAPQLLHVAVKRSAWRRPIEIAIEVLESREDFGVRMGTRAKTQSKQNKCERKTDCAMRWSCSTLTWRLPRAYTKHGYENGWSREVGVYQCGSN